MPALRLQSLRRRRKAPLRINGEERLFCEDCPLDRSVGRADERFARPLQSLDQATKFWFERHLDPGDFVPVIDGFFNLTLAHNYGAAFSFLASMGGWQRWLFSAIALAVIVVSLRLLWKHSRQTLFALSLTLILSGALGNLIDRSLWGYVIDFLDFYLGTWHWPAFNIADTAICLGAAGIIIDELIGVSKERS